MPKRFRNREENNDFGFCFKFPPFHLLWKEFSKYNYPGFCLHKDFDVFAIDKDNHLATPKIFLDEDESGYKITLEIPGISRDEIELDVSTEEIWFRAESEELNRGYKTHLYFRKPVRVEEIKATLKAGILTIQAPFLNKKSKNRVNIE